MGKRSMMDRPDPQGFALAPTPVDPLALPDAPLDMPVQSVAAPPVPSSPVPLPALPSRTLRLRIAAAAASLAIAVAAAVLAIAPGIGGGPWMIMLSAMLGLLIFLCIGWVAWGAMGALFGVMAGAAPVPAASRSDGRARAVIAIPVHQEDPEALVRRIRSMRSSLRATGQSHRFDLAILSDTRDPAMALAERDAVWRLRSEVLAPGEGRIFYRLRGDNHGRKAGNMAEFLRRSGAAWDFVVVLDADSLMAGDTLVEMLRRIEGDPGLGLLQTLPRITGAQTLFARAQAFAASLYGPVHARGLARLQGNTGPFWGHNAIFRTRAFAAACGLPDLPGRAPLGGSILSHDTIEAAFLARAGWRVRFDPDLGGSWEETPETIIDHARRDRRWAQGNLQHLGLVRAAGLPFWSRLQIVQGIMAYLASPLWLALLVVAAADGVGAGAPWGLTLLSALLLLAPRLLIAGRELWRGDCRAWGGRRAFARSAVTELLMSALIAPVMMLLQTRAVWAVLRGRDGGWPPQRRSAGAVGMSDAWRAMQPAVLAGLSALAAGLAVPSLFPWLLPIALPMVVSPWLVVALSRSGRGLLFRCPTADAERPPGPVALAGAPPQLQPRPA
ncbi:MAG: glucans biosynthesis glucosyltransferase MdoH [Paracoccaceae bacterium]|nr:MAG: glucans biosynthesis glucosyltransferase MdoH [Paracoccaceae bacterium]